MTATKFHVGYTTRTRDDGTATLASTIAGEVRFTDDLNDLSRFDTTEHEPCPANATALAFTYSERDFTDAGRLRHDDSSGGGLGDAIRRVLADENPTLALRDARLSRDELAELAELADRWHLNTMRAGCAHQTPVYEIDQYGRRVPSLTLTPPCPITDYKYGHAWLVELVPMEVALRVHELVAKAVAR